jgi:hypothetical protein
MPPTEIALESDSAHVCSNCGASAPGAFCPECGQNTRERLPTFMQFMREATGRYLAFEGKLWKTLVPLLFRPGFLTRAYFAGRRRRYIGPARLFLVSSLLLFAMLGYFSNSIDIDHLRISDRPASSERPSESAKASDNATASLKAKRSDKAPERASKTPGQTEPTPSDKTAPAGKAASDGDDGDSSEFIALDDDLNVNLSFLPESMGVIKKRVDRFNQLTRSQKAEQILFGALRFGPYAMFVLLPAIAALLKALYVGRRRKYPLRPRLYGEHLVFAAHNHAFVFIAVALLVALPNDIARRLVAFWIAVYLVWSMRVVYGGSWLGTAVRSGVLFVVYSVLFGLVTAGLVVVAILMR